MSPFARESKDKPRRRFGMLDIMKKVFAVIIIIVAIAVIIYSFPGVKFLKINFPPVF